MATRQSLYDVIKTLKEVHGVTHGLDLFVTYEQVAEAVLPIDVGPSELTASLDGDIGELTVTVYVNIPPIPGVDDEFGDEMLELIVATIEYRNLRPSDWGHGAVGKVRYEEDAIRQEQRCSKLRKEDEGKKDEQ